MGGVTKWPPAALRLIFSGDGWGGVLVFGILFGAGGWGRVGASVKIRVKVIAALLAASGAAASAAFLTAAAFG